MSVEVGIYGGVWILCVFWFKDYILGFKKKICKEFNVKVEYEMEWEER